MPGIEGFHDSRRQRRGFAFQQQCAGRKKHRLIPTQIFGQFHLVDFRQFGLGRDDAVQQLAVVGQHQQSGGIAVKSADGTQNRIAIAEAFRQQVVNHAAGVFGRTGVPDRFVEQNQNALGRIDGLIVHQQIVVNVVVIQTDGAAVTPCQPAVPDQTGHVFA